MEKTSGTVLKKIVTSSAFFAPLVVFFLYFLQLFVTGIYPFDQTHSVASYDLSAQICPFIEHLFDVKNGKSSLFYSTAVGGGMDVFGTFAYFFISPFCFLFLVCGEGRVYFAASYVMAFKLAAIAFAGAFAGEKLFKKIPKGVIGFCGIVYAYCGYTFVSNTYIGWTDYLVYFPFAVLAFVKMRKTGKFLSFSLCLSAGIYTCFSLGCFSFLTVYPILVCYGMLCVEREKRKAFIATLSLSFFVAVVAALPILYPALCAYLRSARGGSLFENVWFGFTENGFDKSAFLETSATAWYRKFSYIFSDSAFLVLTVAYLAKTRLKTPLSRFMTIAAVYLLVPIVSDEAMNLLNMGSYMSYALRFGFLNSGYLFFGALLSLENIFEKKTNVLKDVTRAERRGVFLVLIGLSILSLLAFVLSGAYVYVWRYILKNEDMVRDAEGFSGMFAHSLGGLQVTAVLFVLVALAFFAANAFIEKGGNIRVVSFFLVALVSVQVVFYNEQLVLGNRSVHKNGESYQTLLSQVELGDYRVKDYGDFLTANEPFTSTTNSFSVFSSMTDKDNFEVQKLFGYSGNGKNTLKSAGGNRFGDALLGYKYYFVPEKTKESVDGLMYLSAVEQDGEPLTAGGFYLYENEIVFPLAFTVSSEGFSFPLKNSSENRTANQFALYEYLCGSSQGEERSVTTRMTAELSALLTERAAKIDVSAGKIKASVSAKEGEYLLLPFIATKGYKATVNGKERKLSENDLHFLCVSLDEGENEVVLQYVSPYPKKIAFGTVCAAAILVLFFELQKRGILKKAESVLLIASLTIAGAVTMFFFAFPLCVFFVKIIRLIV